MKETPTTPYLIRAIWEWCADNGYTPFLSVKVNEDTRVPQEFVRNGEIVLNLSSDATRNLKIGNDRVQFSARFGGVSREVSVPINAVSGIFAKENGQGLAFAPVQASEEGTKKDETEPRKKGGTPPSPPTGGRPRLHVVK
ncbi:MAG: ClpXP protease specificity-enhancing factor [Betaproteobacteria bacterium]|nr:ClpXP protease specificity-enhancing factor [Betaproteobacteria bacterium]